MTESSYPAEAADEAETPGGQIAQIEPALWKRLYEAARLDDFAGPWLALQCRVIDKSFRGIVLLAGKTPNNFDYAAVWPEGANPPAGLAELAKVALRERRPVATEEQELRQNSSGLALAAYPIQLRDEIFGVVAVALRNARGDDLKRAARQLQWGVSWFRERLLHDRLEDKDQALGRSRAALDLLGDALSRPTYETSAMAVATSLASRFRCARVSFGVRRGRYTSVRVISHSAQFSKKMALVSGLAAAMDEAVDQRALVLYPAPVDQIASTSEHANLSRSQDDCAVLTIPVLVADRFTGAACFERRKDDPFDAATIALLEVVVSILGPILEEKRLNDRWLVTKVGESLRLQLQRWLGPGYWVRKLLAIAAIGMALWLTFATDVYRVDADALVEGLARRAVVAPYDGFIKESRHRAGDAVAKDEVLAALEDSDLVLERLKHVTERAQRLHEYDKALATRELAAVNVINTQIEQADAQIHLIDEQISRVTLRSPIPGLIITGDLSQIIGTSVQRGQVLFEVAPLDAYRVVLSVDEHEIDQIQPGFEGELALTALPSQQLHFTVDKVTPIAEARAGKNVFRVEGHIGGDTARLRPGMEGLGKIIIGERNLAWIWLHPALNWWRLASWRWFG